MKKDRNAVNAEYEVLETENSQDTNGTEISIRLNAEVGTISYGDIAKLPEYIRAYIKKLMPKCESGVVPSGAVTAENYAEAKNVRADLNKMNDRLNADRMRIKKQWEKPYDDFKKQFDEKTGLLTAAISNLGMQIQSVETAEKEKKTTRITSEIMKKATDYRAGFDKLLEEHPSLWSKVWKDAYGNKSYADTKIQLEYTEALLAIHDELKTIETMPDSDSIMQAYYRSGDLSKAINEAQQYKSTQKREAEIRASKAQSPTPTPQPTAQRTTRSPQPEEGDIVKVFKVWHKDPREFHALVEYMKAHGFHACVVNN